SSVHPQRNTVLGDARPSHFDPRCPSSSDGPMGAGPQAKRATQDCTTASPTIWLSLQRKGLESGEDDPIVERMTAEAGAWDVTGQRVLVTGASSGLGLAMARALASGGARVALGGRDEGR